MIKYSISCEEIEKLIWGKTIEYDYENRPKKITDAVHNTITEVSYDYAGQRNFKKVSDLQTSELKYKTFYVGNIYEVNVSSSAVETTTKYIYAGSMRVASIVKQGSTSKTYFYHGDHLGSAQVMTDCTGAVVQNISYEPWGNVVTNTASGYDSPYKFTGQMLDDSTGLYYYGARYYDPTLRRFITPDTIVQSPYDPQSLNRYAYCRNNPLIYTDPTGNSWLGGFISTGLIGINTHHWHLPTIWNQNREAFVNAGIAFVTSGFNPVAAVAAFGSTEFCNSAGGEHLIGQFANILEKNNIMGERESKMFSRFTISTLTSMGIEAGMGQLMADPAATKQSYTGKPKDISGGGQNIGTSTDVIQQEHLMYDPEKYRVTMLSNKNGITFVGQRPAFGLDITGKLGIYHTSSLSTNLAQDTVSGLQQNLSFVWGGTCQQYTNANLLRAGFSDTLYSITGSGYISNVIYGIYGGQLWPKIAYNTWESEH